MTNDSASPDNLSECIRKSHIRYLAHDRFRGLTDRLNTIDSQALKRPEKQSQIRTSKADLSGQGGVLVLLGVLLMIILAGLDNTIVSAVMPVALPELGRVHLYAWTFAAYTLAAAVSMPIWGRGSDRWGRRRRYLIVIVAFTASLPDSKNVAQTTWLRRLAQMPHFSVVALEAELMEQEQRYPCPAVLP